MAKRVGKCTYGNYENIFNSFSYKHSPTLINKTIFNGKKDVMANVLDCEIEVSEFKLHSR